MGEPYVGSSTVQLDRAVRRRLQRRDMPLDGVRLITLRRSSSGGAAAQPAVGSRYHHRWPVAGFWRQQWYPSRGEHRPRWVRPHIRGPEGTPMLHGDRVQVLRR
jgi:hypothetical protein